jgi:hypothetical protein
MKHDRTLIASFTYREALHAGLQSALPLSLVATFVLVPSMATRVFKTFGCHRYDFDPMANATRRYLQDDLLLSCDSELYDSTRSVALASMWVYPVGVPVLYFALLWASRDALLTGVPTSLSRATAFLSADYKPAAFMWEPLEMCRKLTLTGKACDNNGSRV